MDTFENLLDLVAGKLLEKPILTFPHFSLTVADLFVIGVIISIAYLVYLGLQLYMSIQVKREKIRKAQSRTLLQLAGYVITITAITYSFSAVGYSLKYLLVGSTALLVGLGLGLQQTFVDILAGVIILIDKNINYGDVVSVDIPSSQVRMNGKIVQIGLRTTVLETVDNELMIIPNSKILNNGMKSLMRERGSVRFRIQVQVAYHSDMEKVKGIIKNVVSENDKIDKKPECSTIIKEFSTSSVTLEARFWMKELFNSENILSEIRFAILKEFNENEIEIPYPHSVVLKKNSDAGAEFSSKDS